MSNDEFGVAEDERPSRRTPLDFIREMQAQHKAASARVVKLRDPDRPEFELVCEVPTDLDEQLEVEARAEKAAKSQNAPAEPLIVACMTLARWCRNLRVRGQEVSEGDGSVFADPALQDALQVPNAWRAVRQLFITDGGKFDDAVILRLNGALQRAAGLSRVDSVVVDEESDPT
jgi:hypothetical protein